ncbi:hypothetical protein SETIT_2G086300v2 [Setaria italica]|uniref:DUF4220 domain-containing protein n=3 Tax=Setaria italica TaxID=4555 RepID=A0A368PWD7_SETIT|nr:hypothetical protein SETIT_2G086300v2 [Setaria italica]
MAALAALLLFQLVFGSARRRSRSALLHGALWLPRCTPCGRSPSSSSPAAPTPPPPTTSPTTAGGRGASSCTFSATSSSPCCAGSSPSGSGAGAVTIPFVLLAATVLSSHAFGVRASWAAGDPGLSKAVADHMKDHAATMNAGKYLVRGPCHRVARGGTTSSSPYRCEMPKDDVITVDMVWELCDREEATFASHGVGSSRIRGACLSYSLSHLLKRRFFGLDCAEAGLAETRRLVIDGLLSEYHADEYTEVFRVIEVELGFLYDFFYTKYACIFEVETTFFFTAVLKIILTFVLGIIVLLKSNFLLKSIPVAESTTRTVDIVVTVLVLGVFVAVEAWHTVSYLGSDWAMVSLACCRLTSSTNRFLPFALRKPFGFLGRRPLFGYWHNSIGQYSVIESSRFLRHSKAFSFETEFEPMLVFSVTAEYLRRAWGNLTTSKSLHFVELPEMLKPQIISFLKSNSDGHPLTNGKASLQRNGVYRQLSWTLQNETQAENMLIWHIATDYLIIALPDDAKGSRQSLSYQHREVATKLSGYCAYLMSEAPELLPGNSVETKFIFEHALYEARETLGSEMRERDQLRKVLTGSGDAGTIFTKGLKLGAKLETIREGSLRWKLMAEFWVETILYVAPSDNAVAHMERLAQGGEFLTHIWALLTHAGILTRNLEPIPD